MHTDRSRGPGMPGGRRQIGRGLAGFALAALGCVGCRPRETGEEDEASRPALAVTAMSGCWELDVGAWRPASDSASAGEQDELADRQPGVAPSFLVPPSRVLLLADSTDEWRRSLVTYRAVPLGDSASARLRDYLRWFVRGDTLWIVWSDRRSRAGIALRPEDGMLSGAARGFPDGDTTGLKARAAAWRINCSTLGRWEPRVGPRP